MLQAADGSWELTNDLAAILGRDADQLRAFAHPVSGPAALLSRVWATALAVVWLEQHAADFRDEWRALAAKARAFIERASASLSAETVWTDAARRFLRGGG